MAGPLWAGDRRVTPTKGKCALGLSPTSGPYLQLLGAVIGSVWTKYYHPIELGPGPQPHIARVIGSYSSCRRIAVANQDIYCVAMEIDISECCRNS